MNTNNWEEEIGTLVRELTRVHPQPKSYVKGLLTGYIQGIVQIETAKVEKRVAELERIRCKEVLASHTADIVERIEDIISSVKIEEAPPFSSDNTFRLKVELINEYLMPHIKERLFTAINLIKNSKIN